MTNRLKAFREGMDNLRDIHTASSKLYAESLDERMNARKVLDKILDEGLGLPGPDYNNESEVIDFRGRAHAFEEGRTQDYLKANLEKVIEEVPEGNLLSLALATKPIEGEGDAKRRSAHETYKKWERIGETYRKTEDYNAVSKDIWKEFEKGLKKRMDAKANPRNEALSDEKKAEYIAMVRSLVMGNEKLGLRLLDKYANETAKEFEKTFEKDKGKMRTYVVENLGKQLESDKEQERLSAMNAVYMTTHPKKK